MNRIPVIYGLLLAYLVLISACFIGIHYGFSHVFENSTLSNSWLYSTSLVNLTNFDTKGFISAPLSFHVFSLIISQTSAVIILSSLLWLCWQLFGNEKEKYFSIFKAFQLTILVNLICESGLFLFFMYAIPQELAGNNFTQKLLAAISLAVYSFNNAGISQANDLFEAGVLESEFILQVGLIGGTIMGNLGIFVIIDLLSPVNLRKRLANPETDWCFLTKVSVFGAAFVLISFSVIYFLTSDALTFSDKNILESISFMLIEGVGARGFGDFMEGNQSFLHQIIKLGYSFFGAGPFSSGGGAGLLMFVFVISLVKGNQITSINSKRSKLIIRNWLLFSLTILVFFTLFGFAVNGESRFMDFAFIFNSHQLSHDSTEDSVIITVLKCASSIFGRLSFIIACLITIKHRNNAPSTF